jgi:hypothetical protein
MQKVREKTSGVDENKIIKCVYTASNLKVCGLIGGEKE